LTVIATARFNNTIAMAADGSGSIGSNISFTHYEPKIIKRKNVLIGSSGVCGHNEALMESVLDFIHEDALWYKNWAKHCLEGDENRLMSKLEKKDSSYLLVVWEGAIFEARPTGSIMRTGEDVHAIGSGREFALGAMYAVYDKGRMSAVKIAEAGVEAACKWNPFCAPPIMSYSVKG